LPAATFHTIKFRTILGNAKNREDWRFGHLRLPFLLDQESMVRIIPGTKGRYSTLVVYVGVRRNRVRRGALVVQYFVRTCDKRQQPVTINHKDKFSRFIKIVA